jgi:hypothetical protein
MPVMLSIAERVEQARSYVITIFELDADTITVHVLEWTVTERDRLLVKIEVQKAVQMRIEVDALGNAELLLTA